MPGEHNVVQAFVVKYAEHIRDVRREVHRAAQEMRALALPRQRGREHRVPAPTEQRLTAEPGEVRRRVRLIEAHGENADRAVDGEAFSAVLCHGVLMYLAQPEPMVDALCRCVAAGGLVSVMALNRETLAVRPALERRWDDALAAFDASGEIGVL